MSCGASARTRIASIVKDGDGNVKQEDLPPGKIVDDPAADRWSDRRCKNDGETVSGKGLAALLGRKGISQDRLRGWLQVAAGSALQRPRNNQQEQRPRQPAQPRGDAEPDDAAEKAAFPPEMTGEPAAMGS